MQMLLNGMTAFNLGENNMSDKTMWIIVLVESGVATTAGVYTTEKEAIFQAETIREIMHPNDDDVSLFQLIQDDAPVDWSIALTMPQFPTPK